MRATGSRWALAAAAALVAGALPGCAALRGPEGRPSGRAGWLVYEVGGLRFEAPDGWRSSGGDGRVRLDAPGGDARLDVSRVDERYADERACLAAAREALRRGQGELERVRRHETTLAGRPAVAQEADTAGWHGWAYGLCDGGVQYRIFFTGRSPLAQDAAEAYRILVASVRVGGEA